MHPTEDWFSLSTRRNRSSYIFAIVMLNLFLAIVFSALYFFEASYSSGLFIAATFVVLYALANFTLTAQRLRDFGVSGWLALLWIPIIILPKPFSLAALLAGFIILATLPGTRGANRYGPDPLSQ
ncbi:DUF805 domain-containing protein [Pseudovibrio ascidiaceicola]|uniref:DUF805 domain-containing protein n=1 Tax=Pseudovibrio ascidiaceicola TaxID=285279 RepID=UPI003D36E4BB